MLSLLQHLVDLIVLLKKPVKNRASKDAAHPVTDCVFYAKTFVILKNVDYWIVSYLLLRIPTCKYSGKENKS